MIARTMMMNLCDDLYDYGCARDDQQEMGSKRASRVDPRIYAIHVHFADNWNSVHLKATLSACPSTSNILCLSISQSVHAAQSHQHPLALYLSHSLFQSFCLPMGVDSSISFWYSGSTMPLTYRISSQVVSRMLSASAITGCFGGEAQRAGMALWMGVSWSMARQSPEVLWL